MKFKKQLEAVEGSKNEVSIMSPSENLTKGASLLEEYDDLKRKMKRKEVVKVVYSMFQPKG